MHNIPCQILVNAGFQLCDEDLKQTSKVVLEVLFLDRCKPKNHRASNSFAKLTEDDVEDLEEKGRESLYITAISNVINRI